MKTSRLLLLLPLITTTIVAADWPQYRGPNQDGSTTEKIATKWPVEGPPVVWRAPLGPSFGSFAIEGGKVFCFIQRAVDGSDKEVAIALDEKTGKELWATTLGNPTYDKQGGDGPRSTPTTDGKHVYLLGAYQILSCLDAASGKIVWQHDLVKEFGGTIIKWNNAASPILEGNVVLVNAGGAGQALLGFDKKTGAVVWKGEDDLPTHATPVPTTILGVRQVIFFTQSGLVSVAPASGKVLWRYAFPYKVSTASSPIVWKDMVYCSAGYQVGAAAVKISKKGDAFEATELWRRSGELMNHWTTPVCKDGYLYGLYGHNQQGTGPLKCVELATGKEMWSQSGFGTGGATILVDGKVLVQADRGPLVLVDPSPDAYHELSRAEVMGGKCWSMPAVSNGKLFARNTKEALCLDVSPKR